MLFVLIVVSAVYAITPPEDPIINPPIPDVPFSKYYSPTYPEHIEEKGSSPIPKKGDSCTKIIKILAPKYPAHPLKVKAYATARRDIEKGSSLIATEPRVACGIRLEIPLIDTRERFERKKELLSAVKSAENLLDDYLETRTEVNYLNHYLAWQWKRVDVGIEYRKDIWQQEIDLKKKQAKLKSLIAQFKALGVPEELLDKCYCETYSIKNCCEK